MVNFVNVPWAKFPSTDNKGKRLNHRVSSEFVIHVVRAATDIVQLRFYRSLTKRQFYCAINILVSVLVYPQA